MIADTATGAGIDNHAPTALPGFPAPTTIEQTGLAADQIEMLLVKMLYSGESTGLALSDRVCLPFPIIEPLIDRARAERLIEVRGTVGSGTAAYRFALTDLGRDRGGGVPGDQSLQRRGAGAARRLRRLHGATGR